MKIDNYILELFNTDEKTVILPGLGALTLVNKATNEMMFMDYLKYNDGTLNKFVAQKDGIELAEAEAKVKKWVDEIITILDKGQSYEVKGIGLLSKDSSGDIQFSTAVSNEDSVNTSVQQSVEDVAEEVNSSVVEEIKDEIVEPVQDIANEIVESVEVSTESTVDKVETKIEEEVASIATTVEPVKEVIDSLKDIDESAELESVVEDVSSPEPVIEEKHSEIIEQQSPQKASEEEQWKDDLDVPPLDYKPEKPKKPILEKTKKDKKPRSNRLIWLILLALIVIGGSAYIGFNYKDLKEKIRFLASKKVEDKNSETSLVEEETPIEESSSVSSSEENDLEEDAVVEDVQDGNIQDEEVDVVQEEKSEPQRQSTPVTISNGLVVDKSLPIQVVTGAFSEESNASRFVEKLRSLGFSAEIIGVYGGLHTISVASFNSMQDFLANKSQLSSVGPYWIKK